MSIRVKIIVAALAAFFVLLLMLLWSAFVFLGRTPIDPFINQIGALITITVGLIAAFFGHQSASALAGAAPVALAAEAALTAAAAPVLAVPLAEAAPVPAGAPVAPVATPTLQ